MGQPNDFFMECNEKDFDQNVVNQVSSIFMCGGNTFLAIQALNHKLLDVGCESLRNPYGAALQKRIKSGQAVYVGQSAGTVAMSHVVGSLTDDPATYDLGDNCGWNSLPDKLGGKFFVPGINAAVGIPYQLCLRPHFKLEMASKSQLPQHYTAAKQKMTLANSNNSGGIDKVRSLLPGKILNDVHVCVLADYDFYKGLGDVLEVSHCKIRYHAGYAGYQDSSQVLPENAEELLNELHPAWLRELKQKFVQNDEGHDKFFCQPPGNPEGGLSFDWDPSFYPNGEVLATGKMAVGQQLRDGDKTVVVKAPFHFHASSHGPIPEEPLFPLQ